MSELAISFILLPQQVISTLSRNRMNTSHKHDGGLQISHQFKRPTYPQTHSRERAYIALGM